MSGGLSTDQGGGKRRVSGLSIIALSLTCDCKPPRPKVRRRPGMEREETPAVLWLGRIAGVPCAPEGPVSGGSLKRGRVNKIFREQAR